LEVVTIFKNDPQVQCSWTTLPYVMSYYNTYRLAVEAIIIIEK